MVPVLLIALVAPPSLYDADFSNSYAVWASADRGACTYWLGDVGLRLGGLRDAIKRGGYDNGRGAEILTSDEVSPRCIREAERVLRAAGFTKIRARAGGDKDRTQGIP